MNQRKVKKLTHKSSLRLMLSRVAGDRSSCEKWCSIPGFDLSKISPSTRRPSQFLHRACGVLWLWSWVSKLLLPWFGHLKRLGDRKEERKKRGGKLRNYGALLNRGLTLKHFMKRSGVNRSNRRLRGFSRLGTQRREVECVAFSIWLRGDRE